MSVPQASSPLSSQEPLAPTRARKMGQLKAANPRWWTEEEDKLLIELVSKQKEVKWSELTHYFHGKSSHQISDRWAKVLDPKLIKGSWTGEEDARIVKWVSDHGARDWGALAERLPGRISKQCRERWHNHLSPNVLKSDWTQEEDSILIECQAKWGNKWSKIAALLPGRTDNSVKNRWNSSIKRRLQRIENGEEPSGRRGRKPKRLSEAPAILGNDVPVPDILGIEIKTDATAPSNTSPAIPESSLSPFTLTSGLVTPLKQIWSPNLQSPTMSWSPNLSLFSPFQISENPVDKQELSSIPGPKLD